MSVDDNPFAAPHIDASAPWASADDLALLKADRFSRWMGNVIDQVVWMVPFGVGGMATVVVSDPDVAAAVMVLAFAITVLPCWVIPWYTIVTRGQSFGKMAVGTRIVRTNGAPVDFLRGVVVRNWVMMMASGVIGGLAGTIDALVIFGNEKRCVHDYLADTIVVQASAWNPY